MPTSKLLFTTTILLLLSNISSHSDEDEFEGISDILVNLKLSDEQVIGKLSERMNELFNVDLSGSTDLSSTITTIFSDIHHPSMEAKGEQQTQVLVNALDQEARNNAEQIQKLDFSGFFAAIDQPVKDFLIHQILHHGDIQEANLTATFQNILMNVISTSRVSTNTAVYNAFRKQLTGMINGSVVEIQGFFNTAFEGSVGEALMAMEKKIKESEFSEEETDNYIEKFVELYKVYVRALREKYGDGQEGEIQNHMLAYIFNSYKLARREAENSQSELSDNYVRFIVEGSQKVFKYLLNNEYQNKAVGKCEVLKKISYYIVAEEEGLLSQVALKNIMAQRKQNGQLDLNKLSENNQDSALVLMNVIDYIREFVNVNETSEEMLNNECFFSDEEINTLIDNFGSVLNANQRFFSTQDLVSQAYMDLKFIEQPIYEEMSQLYNFNLQARLANMEEISRDNLTLVHSDFLNQLLAGQEQNISQEYQVDLTNFGGVLAGFIVFYSENTKLAFPSLTEEQLVPFTQKMITMNNHMTNFLVNLAKEVKPELNNVDDKAECLKQLSGEELTIESIQKYRNLNSVTSPLKRVNSSSKINID